MSFFSVIIPTYNRGPFIRETLESVFRQEETSFEVIVVDDGSTDDTLTILEQYASRIRIVQQPNAGPGAARNRGAAQAEGKYLAFLDSDDLWFPWTLATYRRILDDSRCTSFMTSAPIEFACSSELGDHVREDAVFEPFDDFFAAGGQFRFAGSGVMVIERETFLRVGGFTAIVQVAEDLDLAVRLGMERGYAFIERPPVVAYRQHAGNTCVDVDRMTEGISFLITQERDGLYPGGRSLRAKRHAILTRFTRSASIGAVRNGRLRDGLRLYGRTLMWNVALGRWKYLCSFPALTAANVTRSQTNGMNAENES